MIAVRVTGQEEKLIKQYAGFHQITVSEFIRKAALEKIEEDYDLQVLQAAIEEYENDPVAYSFEEVAAEIGYRVQD